MTRNYILSNQEIAEFCQSLALLLQAGIGLGDGIFLMAKDTSGEEQKKLLNMGQQLDQGDCLFEVLKASGGFPVYVTGIVQVGERTGRLEEALFGLAAYYEERCRISRLVRSSLLYPSMILFIMIMVIGVLLIEVLPVFDQVYASLGSHMTGIAEWLLRVGWGLKKALPVLLSALGMLAVLVIVFSVKEDCRNKIINIWNRYYGDKGICATFNNARFAQALAMGIRSGLLVEEAMDLAGELMENVPKASLRCKRCAGMMEQGIDFAEALTLNGFLSSSACRILKVGLGAGNGDQVVDQIAKKMMEEAEESLENMVMKAEPTMVLAASIMVGIILLAVMLPLVNILASIG